MLVKIARKPSADPVQEKLRQDKAAWNKKTSLFITRVLHFKKLMNGAPNLFYKQKSKIIQPIPANPATILDSLINEFQEISQQGTEIIGEQLSYAKTHRQKQPQAPADPALNASKPTNTPQATTTPVAPDLSKQLSAWEQKYELISEGSNPISRFLTRRITRTRGTSEKLRLNKMRLSMLDSCAKARKALSRLQVQIVKSNKESIPESAKIMQHVWNEWAVVARNYKNYKSRLSNQLDKTTDLPSDESMRPDKETLPDHDQEDNVKQNITPTVITTPTTLTKTQPVNKNKVPSNLEENDEAQNPLEVTAQAFIKKWLGKKRLQFSSENTASYRLEIFEIAKNIRIDLNKIMNILEKTLDTNQLDPLISQINKQVTSLRMLMRSLNLSEKPDTSMGQF